MTFFSEQNELLMDLGETLDKFQKSTLAASISLFLSFLSMI